MKERILLIGGGGHCRSCIDVVEQTERYEIAGIIDTREMKGRKVLGYEIIGSDEDVPQLKAIANALVTVGQIGSPDARIRLYEALKSAGFNLPAIVSPLAHVSRHAQVGEGTIVMHHALVNAGARVGANCIVNSKALIEHDAVIEDHCHISTASVINGGIRVKRGTFWGSGAVGREYTETNEFDFIKANSIFKGGAR